MATSSQVGQNSSFLPYEPVIGLEVHCQLSTKSKLFCSCPTTFGVEANHNVCPVCLGHPGVLPTLNKEAINFAIRFALAVGADISEKSVFARKQYFYPDLPKGYQISQYDRPYCQNGFVEVSGGKKIPLMRAHLEEDAGKNIHGTNASYIDLNRAGIPLIEIVTLPAIESASEAADYLRRLRNIVRYLEICDGNLEEGSFRCDANVSVRLKGEKTLGTRCEIKNLNSFKNVERAINYEIRRQIDVIEAGDKIVQQTLGFDAASGKTKSMRTKEDAHDYRYFPDPDLPILRISSERIEKVRGNLPELSMQKQKRFVQELQLTEYDASFLAQEKDLANYFEDVLKSCDKDIVPKMVANWVIADFYREASAREWDFANAPIGTKDFAELVNLVHQGKISLVVGKKVFLEMIEHKKSAAKIVTEQDLVQISDTREIDTVVAAVIQEYPAQVAEFLSGKEKILAFMVGQVMKRSKGKFNPEIVNKTLVNKINEQKT